eukprot:CAMPEP_0202443462 /NCGR_PEP_ID=MMETSP1360-20130828/2715_1 /ASSEMBLY_ACC=CAM_ASM_000848 /TAXON_ID=515479 /ORGANISM="Licmophora paradoxa, Strain CCMP2313" /LENGTH=182 /DNA_ID=CAMNT_0049059151 /DNA_START=79 /DNA_END=627 /DNA_ORIENTATION=-
MRLSIAIVAVLFGNASAFQPPTAFRVKGPLLVPVVPHGSQTLSRRETVALSAIIRNGEFVNDGPVGRFLSFYLEKFGVVEGKTILYGPFPRDINQSEVAAISDQTSNELRAAAAASLQNIGDDERQRRRDASNIFYKIAAAYAVFASLFLDAGDFDGHLARMAVLPLFAFGYGYNTSAETGL